MAIIAFAIAMIPFIVLMPVQGSSDSPVPGLTALLAFVATMVLGTIFLRRRARRRSGILVSQAEAALQTAVEEISRRLPAWAEAMGGAAALLDSALVTDALMIRQRQEAR